MKSGIAAVVLAAGASQRMGEQNKLLALWQGKPLVRHVVETSIKANTDQTIVVTGHEAASMKQTLDGLDVHLVDNPDYREGLSASLKAGVRSVDAECSGAVILLADMPRLKVATLNVLIQAFVDCDGRSICVPICGLRRGNPVIWPRAFFPDILELNGDQGARALISRYQGRVLEVPCDDEGVLMDIDTPADLDSTNNL